MICGEKRKFTDNEEILKRYNFHLSLSLNNVGKTLRGDCQNTVLPSSALANTILNKIFKFPV